MIIAKMQELDWNSNLEKVSRITLWDNKNYIAQMEIRGVDAIIGSCGNKKFCIHYWTIDGNLEFLFVDAIQKM